MDDDWLNGDWATVGQHDSDVERRMWVKGKLEEINNSNMKMGREKGEKKSFEQCRGP